MAEKIIKLGNLVLNSDMQWQGRENWTGIGAVAKMSLSGKPIIYELEVNGRTIDLLCAETFGLLTYSQVKQLQSMASTKNATYQLTYGNVGSPTVITVRFRHEEDALELYPVADRTTYIDTDWFYGTVRLMEV